MKNKSEYRDMWVFIQHDGKTVEPVSLELCCETRKLCDAAGEKLAAVIVGQIPETELDRVLECGVDKLIRVSGTGYDYLNVDAYANLFTLLCRKYAPSAVMVGGTIFDRDFAPRFACRLPTGCTSDATELVYDPNTGDIEFAEPAVGGKLACSRPVFDRGLLPYKLVVAVNSDPDAPIFNYCDYGLVGDMDEVCDKLLRTLA